MIDGGKLPVIVFIRKIGIVKQRVGAVHFFIVLPIAAFGKPCKKCRITGGNFLGKKLFQQL